MLQNLLLPLRPSLKLRRLKGSVWKLKRRRKGKLTKPRRRGLLKLRGSWR
jgi:hypothetical protein